MLHSKTGGWRCIAACIGADAATKIKIPGDPAGAFYSAGLTGYLPAVASCDEMLVKVALSCEPSVLTTVMIATEMPAAIRPYSIAVAPDSSLAKRVTRVVMVCSCILKDLCLRRSHAGAVDRPGHPNLWAT